MGVINCLLNESPLWHLGAKALQCFVVRLVSEADVDQHAIIAVTVIVNIRLSIDLGTMPNPSLPVLSAMSCSIHVGRLFRLGDVTNVSLSRPARAHSPDGCAKPQRLVYFLVRCVMGRPGHREESVQIDTDEGCGHKAELAQRRIPAADILRRGEHASESSLLCQFLKRRPGISHGNKVGAGFCAYFGQLLPKVIEERQHLGRRA